MKQLKTAFTLVELIVVITILSVLSTVAFVSFQWYTNDARDATKISDLVNIWRNIWNAATAGKQFRTNNLQDITYKIHPWTVNVKIWELTQWVVPGLWETPLDPFTWKPYIVWLYANSDNTANFWQIWGILENRYGEVNLLASDEKFPANVPVQRVVWNYKLNDIYGISGLIPRWAIEDFEWFKNTWFYASGEIMYGSSPLRWYPNSYIFAMDRTPVAQINWYTDEKTLLYESFENVWLHNSTRKRTLTRRVTSSSYPSWERIYNNETISIPTCISKNISLMLSYEFNAEYYDQVRTLNCNISDQWVNSKSALKISWLRDSVWWDGQYNYITIDPTKKYQMSLDLKWRITWYSGNMPLYFRCETRDVEGTRSILQSMAFQFPLDENNYQRVSGYINAPDPSGNNLSINIDQSNVGESTSCIFYRSNLAQAWDELYFDNYIVKEID